jgi:branched-chain amino acid transport system substrate-binding protein
VLLLAGCGSNEGSPAAGREILVLGVAGLADEKDPSLSGMIRGVELAISQYNSNPDSRYEVELKQLGTKVTPGEAGATAGDITKTERLIGVIGPFNEQDVAELGPAFDGAGVPFLVPPLSATSIPEPGWRSFRRLIANDRQEGEVLAGHTARKVAGNIVLVVEESDPGQSFAAGAKEALDAEGRPPARTESVKSKQTYGNLATSLVQGAPDAILFGGGGETGTALLDALRKADFKGLYVASHQTRDMHPKALGGGVISSSPGADSTDSSARSFVEDYREKFDTFPVPFALESYEGAFMLLEAVEEVDAKPREVTQFLQQNPNFLGDSKSYEFDPAGELPEAPVWIYESTDGFWKLAGRSDRLAAPG